jgi:peptide/nickel transport system ATP-binding protein
LKYDIRIGTDERSLVNIDGFQLKSGTVTLLLGESGIGKSLISKAIFGLLSSEELNITLNNLPYSDYTKNLTCKNIQEKGFFVFQEPSSHLNPLRTLQQQLNEGSIKDSSSNQTILTRLFPAFSETERRQLLTVFPKPYRPSGGEKQRILIAMAFKKISKLSKQSANQSALFVFDEPTGNLDNEYRNIFLKMLLKTQKELNFTTLLITHDYSMITEISNQYPDMLPQIEFQELYMDGDNLILDSFSPDSYLNWLGSVKSKQAVDGSSHQPLLSLHSEIHVFNRSFSITTDSKHKNQAPLEIYPGEAVYLKAESGAGKTTLAKIIMGLQPCQFFKCTIGDNKLNQKTPESHWKKNIWAKRMSMVFQHADEALNLTGKVKDIFRGLPLTKRNDRDFLIENLKIVFDDSVDDTFLDQPVAYLSGGQKQRLNLIRALILDTDILILDEPLNGLDFITLQKVMNILQERQNQGKSYLLISHNEEIIDRFVPSNRVYYLFWERSVSPLGKGD